MVEKLRRRMKAPQTIKPPEPYEEIGAGGRAEGGFIGVGGLSVEVELKTKDIDGLFRALEQAKMSKVKF
jgi:hypothetical protein